MIAICIGHSRPNDGGSTSVGGVSEHTFNSRIGAMVVSRLTAMGEACTMIGAYQGTSYGLAMTWLAGRLKDLRATVCVELHFNDADASASGHQWLYCSGSPRGKRLAQLFDGRMQAAFPTLHARGTVGLGKDDRGWGFVYGTPCLAVICEPFFGSNQSDWDLINSHQDRLAQVIADGLTDFISKP